MKNIFVILISILVLNGCKPKSKSSLEFKTDTTTSSKGTNMPDVGDLKTTPLNTMSSGSSNWSMEYRDKFIRDCISKASEKVSNADATSYCNCMTEKVEVKYPNEKEVDAKLTSADIESMRPGCAVTNPTNLIQPIVLAIGLHLIRRSLWITAHLEPVRPWEQEHPIIVIVC